MLRVLRSVNELVTESRTLPSVRQKELDKAPMSAFRDQGVPGPTSKLSSRALAQMGRRETEREGGRQPEGDRRERWKSRGLRVCPAPKSGALAVGGYKRPRGRERAASRERLSRPLPRAINPL
jgi:hypothetical protein